MRPYEACELLSVASYRYLCTKYKISENKLE